MHILFEVCHTVPREEPLAADLGDSDHESSIPTKSRHTPANQRTYLTHGAPAVRRQKLKRGRLACRGRYHCCVFHRISLLQRVDDLRLGRTHTA